MFAAMADDEQDNPLLDQVTEGAGVPVWPPASGIDVAGFEHPLVFSDSTHAALAV